LQIKAVILLLFDKIYTYLEFQRLTHYRKTMRNYWRK